MDMLSRKKQHRYLSRRWYAVRCYIREFALSANPEVLHPLRVEIKKINAFARLAKARAHRPAGAALDAVKQLFRAAGAIRETGLNLALMEKYRVRNAGLAQEKQAQMRQQSAVFAAEAPRYQQLVIHAAAALHKTLRPLRGRRARRWFKGQLRKTDALLAAPMPGRLHDARKKIKTLLYVHSLLPKRLANKLHVNKTYLHRLQEKIGNWHDAAVAASLLPQRSGAGTRLHKALAQQERDIQTMVKGFREKAKAATEVKR